MRKKICLLFLLCAVACGGQQFDKTYGYVVTSVNAAREGFLMWDQDHQQDIVTHAATPRRARMARPSCSPTASRGKRSSSRSRSPTRRSPWPAP